MKAMNKRPNQNSQFAVHMDRNSRNSTKNSAPSAGPRKERMPPMTTMGQQLAGKGDGDGIGRGEAVVEGE